jgi:predicted metalloprotease
MAIAGCGGSGHSSTTTKGQAHAATGKPTKVAGVASPQNAVPASRAKLSKLVHVTRGASPHIQGLDNAPITQAIPTLSADLNQFWSQEFATSGVQWPTVDDNLVQNSSVSTPCSKKSSIAPSDPMFLCYSSSAVNFYWTIPWMQTNVDTDPGGVNLALGMASMYADVVQTLFGYYQQVQGGQMSETQYQEQNLCLAGVYAASLNNRRLFEQSDVQTIKNWLGALSGGTGSGSAGSQQLAAAFGTGFQSGSPAACGVQAATGTT